MDVRSTRKLQWFHGGVIVYNKMKFRSNPFSFAKVIKSSCWFGHIHSTLTLCNMENETSFEIRVYIKGCLSFTDIKWLLERGKVSSALSSTLFARHQSLWLFLFPLLKKIVMNSEVHLVVQFNSVFRVYLKRPSLPLQNGFPDLKVSFP